MAAVCARVRRMGPVWQGTGPRQSVRNGARSKDLGWLTAGDAIVADIATGADTSATMAVSSTGLLLRGAGATQDQINRTAWLFGFDAPEAAA